MNIILVLGLAVLLGVFICLADIARHLKRIADKL